MAFRDAADRGRVARKEKVLPEEDADKEDAGGGQGGVGPKNADHQGAQRAVGHLHKAVEAEAAPITWGSVW